MVGLALISTLMVVYFVFFAPKPTPPAPAEMVADSLQTDTLNQVATPPAIAEVVASDSLAGINQDSLLQIQQNQLLGGFGAYGKGTAQVIYLENTQVKLGFSSHGAKLVSAELKEYQTFQSKYRNGPQEPLQLMVPDSSDFNLAFFHQNRLIETNQLYFEATQPAPNQVKFVVRPSTQPNAALSFLYSLPSEGYMADMQLQMEGMQDVVDPGTGFIDVQWRLTAPQQELDLENERTRSTIYYREKGADVERVTRGGPGEETLETEVDWVSFKQQFFSTTLIVPSGLQKPKAQVLLPGNDQLSLTYQLETALVFENKPSQTVDMKLYAGPNHYQSLKKLGYDLEDQIDLGYIGIFKWVNTLLIIPVFNFFENLGLGYGLIIFLLTLIIKIILSPLNFKTFVSSAKMRVLKPEVDELNAKFKPDEALKKQQAMMQLYRQAGVNPLAGCLPALLQMPILLAMFSFFPSAIELRQEGFLWAEDLSTYDSIAQLPFSIPFYGDHVSLFTLLMTITTIIYTWMSTGQMQSGPQAQQMKIMMFLMPIVFLGVLNNYSSALSYYYFLSNLVSIIIMLVIRRFFIDEKKLRQRIEFYMANPTKAPKSKWMQRLADAQKAREEQLKNQTAPKNRSGRRLK